MQLCIFTLLISLMVHAQELPGDIIVQVNPELTRSFVTEVFKFSHIGTSSKKMKLKLQDIQVNSKIQLDELGEKQKKIIDAVTSINLNEPILDLFYGIDLIVVDANLSDIKYEVVQKGDKFFVKAKTSIQNLDVKIPKIEICNNLNKVRASDFRSKKNMCNPENKDELDNIHIKQKNKNIDWELNFEIDLNNKQMIKFISLSTNMNSRPILDYLEVKNFSIPSIHKLSLFMEDEEEFSSVNILEEDIKSILLAPQVVEGILKKINISVQKELENLLAAEINNNLGMLFNKIQENKKANLTLGKRTSLQLDDEKNRNQHLLEILHYNESIKNKNTRLITAADIIKQIQVELNGLNVEVETRSVKSTGKGLELHLDVNLNSNSMNSREKKKNNIVNIDDLSACYNANDALVAIGGDAIASILDWGSELDLYNKILKKNTLMDYLEIKGLHTHLIPSSQNYDGFSRIVLVAELEIDLWKKNKLGYLVEGANSFLRKTDLWWKFGVFPESDTPSIRFPLELSYKISNQMDGVKLIPESPFDKRGDLKNSFGYNSNIKSKISLVQEKVNQDILKLFIDAKTNEKIGLGLTKDFPVMKIKNLTQDWVTVEKLDVSDSGYLVLSIDLNQDNFFPSSYKEVRK